MDGDGEKKESFHAVLDLWALTVALARLEISKDGKGRWRDSVFIERLWHSLKYECVFLHEFEDGRQARQTIADWLRYYNEERPHSRLAGNRTPIEAYTGRKAA